MAEVFYIDFGNIEKCAATDLLALSEEMVSIAPQAIVCSLDGVSNRPEYRYFTLMILFDDSLQTIVMWVGSLIRVVEA